MASLRTRYDRGLRVTARLTNGLLRPVEPARMSAHATILPCDAYRLALRVKTLFVMQQRCSER